MSAAYRVRQFLRAVSAWVQPEDGAQALVSDYLPAAARDLYWVMPRYDRRHALSVVRSLDRMGQNDPDLVAAALLHDAGKTADRTRPLRLWHRVAVVLLRTFAPSLLERIAQDQAANWRRPFYVQLHHGEIGATLAREAGCSLRTAELIRRHEDPPCQDDDPLLMALRTADSMN